MQLHHIANYVILTRKISRSQHSTVQKTNATRNVSTCIWKESYVCENFTNYFSNAHPSKAQHCNKHNWYRNDDYLTSKQQLRSMIPSSLKRALSRKKARIYEKQRWNYVEVREFIALYTGREHLINCGRRSYRNSFRNSKRRWALLVWFITIHFWRQPRATTVARCHLLRSDLLSETF